MSSEVRSARQAPVPVAGEPLRLLFVVPFSPRVDNRHGGKVVAHLLGRLAERHDVGLVHLTAPGLPPVDSQLAARCAFVRTIEMRSWADETVRHRFRVLTAPFTRRPSQVANVYSRQLPRTVRDLVTSWRPDVVQIEHDSMGYCGSSIADLDVARVLVCHDPGLKASQDQALVTTGRQHRAHLLDAASWKAYWSRTLPTFDAVVAFTRQDASVLRPFVSRTLAQIPLGIELPASAASPLGAGLPSVLFIGGYSHPPNSDAALRLIRSIMPLVRRRLPGLRLLLVGDRPTDAMVREAGPDDVISGSVPDVWPFLNDTAVVALPIRLGGGMRVKLMEALAAGKAVVASPVAAAGLDVADGRELSIAVSDEEFAEAMFTLFAEDGSRMRLGLAARDWALANLAVSARADDYERLYRSLLASRR